MSHYLDYTDSAFVYAGKSYPHVPLLIGPDHSFVEPVCAYFRHLILREHLEVTSTKTYAEYILHFWKFLATERVPFDQCDDALLIRWFNRQTRDGVGAGTMRARCDTVFDFYIWLEVCGHIRHFVRVPGFNDSEKFVPQLSARPVGNHAKSRRTSKYGIVSGVRPKDRPSVRQPTPSAADITDLYIEASKGGASLYERNSLLIDWYVQTGVRRLEWRALSVQGIPGWNLIDTQTSKNEAHELQLVVTKGKNFRHISVLPELLAKTREYIEVPRADIVARFKKKHPGTYVQPEEIFLSNKTGLPLNLTSISNMLTQWFSAAGVKGHGHRLRAVFLTNLCEAELSAEEAKVAAFPGSKIDFELVLMKVAERAGHKNVESLRSYLNLVRKRRGRRRELVDPVTLQQQVTARKQELDVIEKKLALRKAELNCFNN